MKSNRLYHFVGGFLVGLVIGAPASAAVGASMEWKDRQWGGRFDWVDLALTALGGIAGHLVTLWIAPKWFEMLVKYLFVV